MMSHPLLINIGSIYECVDHWNITAGHVTCFAGTRIAEATIIAQLAIEVPVLLHGGGVGQKHAQHGDILVIILGLLDPLRANGLGLQVKSRLHSRTKYIHVGHDRELPFVFLDRISSRMESVPS